jgi:RNA polymerase sigma factor (sigma-70 family)
MKYIKCEPLTKEDEFECVEEKDWPRLIGSIQGYILKLIGGSKEKYENQKEMYQEVWVRLLRKSHLFDPNKGRYTTWSTDYIIDAIRKWKKKQHFIHLPQYLVGKHVPPSVLLSEKVPEPLYEDAIQEDVSVFLKVLNDTEKRIVEMSLSGKTNSEIALELSASKQYVSKILLGAEEKIRRCFQHSVT